MVLAMPRGHRLARAGRVHLRDLAGERLIVPPPEARHRQTLTRVLGAAGVDWEIALEASGWPLMLEYVRIGVGLAIVNDICRLPAGTTAVPIPELPAIDYYLLEPAGRRRATHAESLRALIIGTFKR